MNQERALTRNWHLDPVLLAPKTGKYLLFKPPVYGVFLQQPEPTKTLIYPRMEEDS